MGGRRVAPVGQESVPDGSRFTRDTSIGKIERHYYRYLGGLTDPREAARRKHVA